MSEERVIVRWVHTHHGIAAVELERGKWGAVFIDGTRRQALGETQSGVFAIESYAPNSDASDSTLLRAVRRVARSSDKRFPTANKVFEEFVVGEAQRAAMLREAHRGFANAADDVRIALRAAENALALIENGGEGSPGTHATIATQAATRLAQHAHLIEQLSRKGK